MFIIYGLLDPRDGQLKYIGKTSSARFVDRMSQHRTVVDRTKRSKWIRKLEKLSLKPQIIELESFSDEELAYVAETEWISMARHMGCSLLNHTDGGEGFRGNHTVASKQKMSLARRGVRKPPRTKEHCDNIRLSKLGKPRKPETVARMSESLKGRSLSPETRAKISVALKGRPKKV